MAGKRTENLLSPQMFYLRMPTSEETMDQIFLDRNENQYGPAPGCYEALRSADLHGLSRYSRAYVRGTQGDLAERLSDELGIPEKQILLGYGSEDLLKQAVHCYLHAGETVLLPRQSWWYYHALAGEVSGRQEVYNLYEREGAFCFDADQIIALYERCAPAVILLASPNNPTGNSIAGRELLAVVRHCPTAAIILDQAYHGAAAAGRDNLRHLLESHNRLVVLRTFSKYYALAGLRIGYACVTPGSHRLTAYSARYLGYNRLSERIALAALDDPLYYRTIQERMDEDKAGLERLFTAWSGFVPFQSDANFLLVRYPAQNRRLLQEGLRLQGIAVKFLDEPGLESCMRISLGTRDQNSRLMDAIREIVEPQPIGSGVASRS